MKKRVLALTLAVVATLALTACGDTKTGTCDLCGKEDVKVKSLSYDGEKGWFCDDCYDTAESLVEMAKALQ